MIDKQTFSVNQAAFPMSDYDVIQNKLKVNYVPIVDVASGAVKYQRDEALVLGKQMDVFCRSPNDGKYFKGNVWPGNSYFPDMFHPNCSEFWGKMMKSLHDKCNFTGIWLDMNEPANFCNGECTWDDPNQHSAISSYKNDPIHLPYIPGGFSDLNYKSLRKIFF